MSAIGRKVTTAGFSLATSNLLATLISAVGSIVIARLLTPSEYGLLGVALVFPLMLEGFLDLGLSTALIRFPSLGRNVEGYVTTGLFFKLFVASVSSFVLFLFADALAWLLVRPYIASMLRILSLYAFSRIVLTAVINMLIGLGEYGKACTLIIVQNAFRASISIALILAGLRIHGAIWGFSISYTLSSIIALAFISKYIKVRRFSLSILKEMLMYSLPLYIPVLLGAPVGQYLQLLLAWFATDEEIGNYRVTMNLLTPLNIVGSSVSTALLSTFPSIIDEDYKLRSAIAKASLFTTIVISPLALALIVLAKPAIFLIYGDAYRLAPIYLSVAALHGLLTSIGAYIIDPYLNSIGATTITMRIKLLSMVITIPLATILVRSYGVLGLIVSTLLSTSASAIYALHILSSRFSVKIHVHENAKALAPPLLALAASYIISFPFNHWMESLIRLTIYSIVLSLLIPVFIDRHRIIELRELISEIKLLRRLFSTIFTVELKIADIIRKKDAK